MKTLVIFSHGRESGPWGSKIKQLAGIAERYGTQVVSPDYRDLSDPDKRIKRLLGLTLPPHDRLILVGSSMGGYVSTVASQQMRPCGLFLMAPAFYLPGYAVQDPEAVADHTTIVFGWRDDMVPPANGIRFAQKFSADLHLIDGDHRLTDALPLVERIFEHVFLQTIGFQLK